MESWTLLLLRVATIATAVAVMAFGFRTAWVAMRSPIGHPYWWAFVSLLGAPVTTVDWWTGRVTTAVFSVQFLNAGFGAGPPGTPAWIAVAFPVGALLFRQRRRHLVGERFPARPESHLPP
jgi:hypothetical protein